MIHKFFLFLIVFVLVLTASCDQDQSQSPNDPVTDPTDNRVEEPYPGPGQQNGESKPIEEGNSGSSQLEEEPYPEPIPLQPKESGDFIPSGDHDYAPVLEDNNWVRGDVFIDKSEVLILESYPVQVELILIGNLPTPCHNLRVVVSHPDEDDRIGVETYSVSDPDLICTQVLAPFEARVPLGEFRAGAYTVWVNDGEVGQINLP